MDAGEGDDRLVRDMNDRCRVVGGSGQIGKSRLALLHVFGSPVGSPNTSMS
jgi:hypothetical protein